MNPLLQVDSVSKVFESGSFLRKKRFTAVNDVSFTLSKGEVLAIVGESGSGKSTLARMIVNLIPATKGRILLEGSEVGSKSRSRKSVARELQMIFQDPFETMNPNHRVHDVVGRPLRLHGATGDIREQVLALLRKVGLTPAEDYIDKYASQLSGGQKQRVMIARALGINPRVLVADEPTSMLDVSIGIDIMNLMLDLKQDYDLALIWITHNLGSARYMSDRMLIMNGGRIVESGDTEAIIAAPRHAYTRTLLEASPDPWRRQELGDAARSPAGTAEFPREE
ncbi:ABC transporter ATP-binding protein [Paenibacillus glycinis]|uniref:ATP-binding cassette domain-containing protein n=1 Tax=Paenibacillus glycinis TaxID=2697035 RepID=A0ABW9XK39_9BACL|nr:ATP-binding cassette domain-containing protein [Paenibacillus glycinis]NBD22980.1 ATP-binding cassette domain-containing protein [Paenibacillus glycinis]